jgi:hypothetical protein
MSIAVAVVALAGCGGTSTASTSSVPATAMPSNLTPTSALTEAATTTTSSITAYQPATVVAQHPGYMLLNSPDSLAKVSAYYTNQIEHGGWQTISSSKTGASTNLVVKKGHEGSTITLVTSGTGTSISVSDYDV